MRNAYLCALAAFAIVMGVCANVAPAARSLWTVDKVNQRCVGAIRFNPADAEQSAAMGGPVQMEISAWSKFSWALSLRGEGWRLKKGTAYFVRVFFYGADQKVGDEHVMYMAAASNKELVSSLPSTPRIARLFAHSHTMRIHALGRWMPMFPLVGSASGVRRFARCIYLRLGPALDA